MLKRRVFDSLKRRFGGSRDTGLPASPGRVCFGDLRRVTPISQTWGFDRGRPVDRYYIEAFLERHAGGIRGRVLEAGDNAYTRRFGADRVKRSDVLHIRPGASGATIVADLATADHIPADAFDCIILTQTLQLVYDTRAAVATLHRILKPEGLLLATVPGISQLDRYEWRDSWCWSFTTTSVRRLLEERFEPEHVSVEARGNVLAAVAFLHGLAAEELTTCELDYVDPHYQLVIMISARRS